MILYIPPDTENQNTARDPSAYLRVQNLYLVQVLQGPKTSSFECILACAPHCKQPQRIAKRTPITEWPTET
jgi:hypothetical protein